MLNKVRHTYKIKNNYKGKINVNDYQKYGRLSGSYMEFTGQKRIC